MIEDDVTKRLQRYEELRQRAATSLNLPLDHERVTAQAMIWLVYEAQTSNYIATGRMPELAAFTRLSELVIEHAPPAPIPEHKLDLRIIPRDVTRAEIDALMAAKAGPDGEKPADDLPERPRPLDTATPTPPDSAADNGPTSDVPSSNGDDTPATTRH